MNYLINSLRYLPTFLLVIILFIGNNTLTTSVAAKKEKYITSTELIVDEGDTGFISLEDKRKWCKKSYNCKLLTEVAYYESRNQHDMGVIAVMFVVINRSHSTHTIFKQQGTLKDVVYKKHQFSYLWDGSVEKGMRDKRQVDRIMVLGYDVLNGLVDSPVGDSLYYHTLSVRPNWSNQYAYTVTVGDHKFYKH